MSDSKKCFKCGEVKLLTDFYKHKMMADGRLNKCKECAKKDVRDNRADKVEYYRDYDKKRFKEDPRVAARLKKYRQSEKGKETAKRGNKKYISKNPIKRAANIIVNNHLRNGSLIKTACEVCGEKKVQGHHDDYAFPLTVRWLCAAHHKQWHEENGEGANGS